METFMIKTGIDELRVGCLFLIACTVCYLIWWMIAFAPEQKVSKTWCIMVLLLTVMAGLTGVYISIKGILKFDKVSLIVPIPTILIGATITYLLLLVISYVLLKRPVTTELILIVLWSSLEFMIQSILYSYHLISRSSSIIGVILIIAGVIIGLICYLLYYRLEAKAAYISAMIPLIVYGLVMGYACYQLFHVAFKCS